MKHHPLQDRHAFRGARHRLGLSANAMAEALHVSDGRTVRRWESGERDIPGPAAVAVALWLDPACPAHLKPRPGIVPEEA